ncbi:MAG: transposase [Pseudohongiellaceae bacterium]
MNELSTSNTPAKRRRYSTEFKRKMVAACSEPHASVPKVAMAHGLNANMVHRWIRQLGSKNLPSMSPGFVALPMSDSQALRSSSPAKIIGAETIRVEIPYRQQSVSVSWPVSQTDRCLAFLRELLQ